MWDFMEALSASGIQTDSLAPLIDRLPSTNYIIADRGYDSEALREQIRDKSALPIIPKKKHSKRANADIEWCLYKYHHLVANVFAPPQTVLRGSNKIAHRMTYNHHFLSIIIHDRMRCSNFCNTRWEYTTLWVSDDQGKILIHFILLITQ